MVINYRDFILADFFFHAGSQVPLEKNLKKNRFRTDDINLLYQRQFPPIGHIWTGKKKKMGKCDDELFCGWADNRFISLKKVFFLYM